MPQILTTPVMRLVQGHPHVPNTTDQQGAPLIIKTGPNTGQPRVDYFVGLAIAKTDPDAPSLLGALDAECRLAWPNLFGADGRCILPGGLSNKIIDGDGVDTTGKLWSTREGFAGHWVIRASSGFAPNVVKRTGPETWSQITQAEIKCGDFVRAQLGLEGNGNASKPGIYVNLRQVCWEAFGPAIINGPSAAEAFGAPARLPPGASVTPVSGPPLPVATPAPQAGYVPPTVAPAPYVPPLQPAPVPVDPNAPQYTNYMGAPPPAPAAPVPTVPVMLKGGDYHAYIAAGWTDATLRQHGHIV